MTSGIISEYNIFHNGHKYMINEIKNHSDTVAAVMSGSFVQRGDVAITDKWTRAKTALLNGVDLVVELPVCYALNAAPNFAEGGVKILDYLDIDEIAFGSECGDIDTITAAANIMEQETYIISDLIKKHMANGLSYARAITASYKDTILPEILSSPNNILAVEYCRSLIRNNIDITPVTIKRTAVKHDDTNISSCFASASQIRNMLFKGEDISKLVPYDTDILNGNIPYNISMLDTAIIAVLRNTHPKRLKNISEVTEGIENRITEAAMSTDSFITLAHAIKSRRYTLSKIRRILLAALINFTKDIYSPDPEYIRVLGMNKKGMNVLKKAKKNCPVPIITKAADFKEQSPQFQLDLRASNIAALCHPSNRNGNTDFTTSPVIINN